MSEYSGIRGTRVKYLASDPTLNTSTEGQVWYNSTSGTLKSLVQIKAWSSGGNLSTARYHSGPATSAPSTAGMVAAGFSNSSPETATNVTEEYNGFSWSSGGNVNTARANLGGAGIQTAALIFGGYSGAPNVGYNLTEEYDGSAWTSGGTLPVNTSLPIGAGTQTAGLSIGGIEVGVAALTTTNLYNGTAWTNTGHNINDDGYGGAGVGTSTAALIMGGDGRVSSVESYDGSSWTAVTNLVSANGRNAGAGTNTFANCFGGSTNPTANQTWDGNTWVSVTGLSTGRARLMGFGTATQSVAAGGYTTTQLANTEEYVSSIDAYSPSTVSAWASGGNLSTARSGGGTGGISTDAIVAGGSSSSPQEAARISGTEIYNGTSWTSSPSIGSSRYGAQGAGKTSSTGLLIGGYANPLGGYSGVTEEYNGTSWSESGDLSTGRGYSFTGGLQTAAWAAGGRFGPPFGNTNATENYNGTAWTSSGTLPMPAIYNGGGSGPQTAGFAAGGIDSAVFTNSQFYDSSTWTAGPTINTGRENSGGAGDSTTALIFGGNIPPNTAQSEAWDGTSWSVDASLGTATMGPNAGEVGTATTALSVGGRTGPTGSTYVTKTEEYTPGSPITPTGAQASTLTTS